MERRQRRRHNTGPLLVTEIILPKTENPASSNTCLENITDFKSEMQETGNSAAGCLVINNHEIKPVGRLISLNKSSEEPYFRGTQSKKVPKRKSKKQQKKHELLFDNSQCRVPTEQETKTGKTGMRTQQQTEKSLTFKEIIERNKIQEETREYEKFKKQSDRKNEIKQRLAEQKHIEKYENLAETWLELMKRMNQLKEEGFKCSQPPHGKSYNKRMRISIFPKKLWCPDECVPEKKEEVDELTLDKLVFVDDESDDELESSYRRRNKA